MNKITITTDVINGNLKRNRKLITDAIHSFEGKTIEITLKRKRKERSNPQNRYYHGCLIVVFQNCIKDSWGEVWSREKCHEFLKARFLFTEKVNEDTGEIAQIPKSTTECTTVEFEEYLEECRQFMLEWFDTDCPLPNQDLQLEL
jgi:hypothetical protein